MTVPGEISTALDTGPEVSLTPLRFAPGCHRSERGHRPDMDIPGRMSPGTSYATKRPDQSGWGSQGAGSTGGCSRPAGGQLGVDDVEVSGRGHDELADHVLQSRSPPDSGHDPGVRLERPPGQFEDGLSRTARTGNETIPAPARVARPGRSSSTTTTSTPAPARWNATDAPTIPAPITTTFTAASWTVDARPTDRARGGARSPWLPRDRSGSCQ
jgi:hypothetical protein